MKSTQRFAHLALRKTRLAATTLSVILLLAALAFLVPTVSAARPAPDAQLIIPAIDVQAPVVHVNIVGGYWDVSKLGATRVGHLEKSAWLGESSNIVIAGHSETAVGAYNGVFARLHRLKVGDQVIITEGGITWQYVVSEIRTVPYTDVSIVFPTPSEQLTLFTCALDSYDPQLRNYRLRLVVVARPLE